MPKRLMEASLKTVDTVQRWFTAGLTLTLRQEETEEAWSGREEREAAITTGKTHYLTMLKKGSKKFPDPSLYPHLHQFVLTGPPNWPPDPNLNEPLWDALKQIWSMEAPSPNTQDPKDPQQKSQAQIPQDTPRGLTTIPWQFRAVLAAQGEHAQH